MQFPQLPGLFEKIFGRDGEELGGIYGTIFIQKRVSIPSNVMAELLVVFLQNAGPGYVGGMVLNNRGTVTPGTGAVELVREFVKDNVMTIMNIGGTAANVNVLYSYRPILAVIPAKAGVHGRNSLNGFPLSRE